MLYLTVINVMKMVTDKPEAKKEAKRASEQTFTDYRVNVLGKKPEEPISAEEIDQYSNTCTEEFGGDLTDKKSELHIVLKSKYAEELTGEGYLSPEQAKEAIKLTVDQTSKQLAEDAEKKTQSELAAARSELERTYGGELDAAKKREAEAKEKVTYALGQVSEITSRWKGLNSKAEGALAEAAELREQKEKAEAEAKAALEEANRKYDDLEGEFNAAKEQYNTDITKIAVAATDLYSKMSQTRPAHADVKVPSYMVNEETEKKNAETLANLTAIVEKLEKGTPVEAKKEVPAEEEEYRESFNAKVDIFKNYINDWKEKGVNIENDVEPFLKDARRYAEGGLFKAADYALRSAEIETQRIINERKVEIMIKLQPAPTAAQPASAKAVEGQKRPGGTLKDDKFQKGVEATVYDLKSALKAYKRHFPTPSQSV